MSAGVRSGALVDAARFGPLTIAFDSTVLRPRPWTEVQSTWAADLAQDAPAGAILELCAGAGHIGLLAAFLSGRALVQVDADAGACRFARANAEAAGIGDRVDVRCAAVDDALAGDETFPLIVADPPYLRTTEVARFPEDPVIAVDGGGDGLGVIRRCLDVVGGHLSAGGVCLLQLRGPAQVRAIEPLLVERGLALEDARVVDDERAVALIRKAGPC